MCVWPSSLLSIPAGHFVLNFCFFIYLSFFPSFFFLFLYFVKVFAHSLGRRRRRRRRRSEARMTCVWWHLAPLFQLSSWADCTSSSSSFLTLFYFGREEDGDRWCTYTLTWPVLVPLFMGRKGEGERERMRLNSNVLVFVCAFGEHFCWQAIKKCEWVSERVRVLFYCFCCFLPLKFMDCFSPLFVCLFECVLSNCLCVSIFVLVQLSVFSFARFLIFTHWF